MNSEAFREGYAAAEKGHTDLANPYVIGSDSAMDWNDGFELWLEENPEPEEENQ